MALRFSVKSMARPYLQLRVEELERKFADARGDRRALQALQGELNQRSTERAAELLRKVERALSEPASKPSSAKPAVTRRAPRASPRQQPDVNGQASVHDAQDVILGRRPTGETGLDNVRATSRAPGNGSDSPMPANEDGQLHQSYERLRERLLDMTLRNPMLSYKHRPTSKRQLQIVDEIPEAVFRQLTGDAGLVIAPLPEPDDVPRDEKTDEFISALGYGKATDDTYLEALREADEAEPEQAEAIMVKGERALRDRLRAELGMPKVDRLKPVDPVQHARELGINPSFELGRVAERKGHTDGSLQTLKFPKPLDAILEKLRGDARLAEQETGLSTLFLVFGFLEWTEQDGGTKLLAPLLLLPVHLEAKRSDLGRISYELTATSTVPEDNLSLRKRIDKDFGLKLPEVAADAEGAFSVEAYLAEVQSRIQGQKDWRIRRFLTVGHFVFGRLAMYADLDHQRWGVPHPAETALVGAIMQGAEGGDDAGPLFGTREDHPIDEPAVAAKAPFLIHDADASQHSALVDAMDGKNLVIQGPPGTGKSQTITNLIANALAAGKTVLFLAEKQAALEVVKRRLDVAGLGEFCLELHSDKASPKSVIEHLKRRLDLGGPNRQDARAADDATLAQCRADVSGYVAALHGEADDGAKPFDLMWKAIRSKGESPEVLDAFAGVDPPQARPDRVREIGQARVALKLYAEVATTFAAGHGAPEESPWDALRLDGSIGPGMAGAVVEDLRNLRATADEAARYLDQVGVLGIGDLAAANRLIGSLAGIIGPAPSPSLLDALRRHPPETVAGYVADLALAQELDGIAEACPMPEGLSGAQMDAVEGMAAALPNDARSPRQILESATRARAEAETVAAALHQAEPAFQAFSLRVDAPVDAIGAIVVAAQDIAHVTTDDRPWFAWRPEGDFAAAHEAWRKVAAAEAAWRARYPSARTPWPGAGQLRAVSGLLQQGFLARLFSGRRKQAVAVTAEHLGVHDLPATDAGVLEKLAEHVEALGAFASSEANRHLMGRHWAVLDTPFDAAARGQDKRNATLARIRACTHGELVAERVAAMGEYDLGRVVEALPSLDALRRLPEAMLAGKSGPLAEVQSDLRRTGDRLARVAAADPQGTLATQDEPLAKLAEAVRVERGRQAARARLERNPLGADLPVLPTDEILADVRSASEWLRTVLGAPLIAPIRDRLLGSDADRTLAVLREAAQRCTTLADRLAGTLDTLKEEYGIVGLGDAAPGELRTRLDALLARASELAILIDLHGQRRDIAALGLDPFVERVRACGIEPIRLPELFDGLVARRRAEWLRRRDPVLSQAAGGRIEARRRAFAEADRRKTEGDRASIRETLLRRQAPHGNGTGPKGTWTEGPLLRNEIHKQRRFVPVRDLMRRASGSLQAFTPCFMMSPLSLAKFLPRGKVRFDLLVIDEASQMRPEDALGALLRVGQVVVVGDQKQLPPSQFFNRSGGAEAIVPDDETVDDLDDESILESCAKTFRETRLLKWHYRSRCESLIAFSNREFYDGDLITFPSAQPRSFSVELRRLPGRYASGRNAMEAQSVAEEAILFMRRHADEAAPPSLGIVSVNSDQRELIEEELRRLASDDDLVLRYQEKVAERGEPFFVKNLENVQGDERDYVFISMTYGPAVPGGVVAQRFGPIAGKHGHRRLNVLFTRARLRIVMFASFGSKDVRPSEASAEGVHVLKRYFEYAERRGYADVDPGNKADSDFEVEVARRLRAASLEVDHQVGVSGFRIDLGVRHPDHPERFIAGVECDGARFHSSKSARDRDRLREEILTGLGWDILRVWSTDWFDDPDLQTKNLIRRIEELRAKPLPAAPAYSPAPSLPEDVEAGPAEAAVPAETEHPIDVPVAEDVPQQKVLQVEATPHAMDADTASLLVGDGPLDTESLRRALRAFRDTVIASEVEAWRPERSVLRESMIEMLVAQRLDDPDQWFVKVPNYLRVGTDPNEKRLYLDRVCDLVARLRDNDGPRAARKGTQGHRMEAFV